MHDAKTVLSNSGTAIMGSAKEAGANRAKNAIVKALDSPLLNDNKITGAKNVLLLIISGRVEVTLDEIGEINDFIQIEAGYDANIIMGVGEDETLEDALAVTIVATGFASEQQSDITNTEEKKIIHLLENEQKAVYDFDQKDGLQTSENNETVAAPVAASKIVHQLGEEEEEKLNTIVKTTSFIQNIDVVYDEIVGEAVDQELINAMDVNDFVIEEVVAKPLEEVTEEAAPVQMDLLFDLPIATSEKATEEKAHSVYFDLDDDADAFVKNIEVIDAVEVKHTAEETTLKRYVLEEEMEEDTAAINAIEVHGAIDVKDELSQIRKFSLGDFENIEPTIKSASQLQVPHSEEEIPKEQVLPVSEALEDELNFTVTVEERDAVAAIEVFEAKEVSPMDLTISELKMRSDKRREKMKNFNYKFAKNVHNNVEEIEKQPAYKRMGVDLSESKDNENIQSRTTLSVDDNDEIQLRSNNSFLHDNVD